MPRAPGPPFERWPAPHHADPAYGVAWWCGNGLVVSHIMVEHGSVASAHAYHDFEDRVLSEHATEVRESGGLFVIHDWRAMETYDSKARVAWQERMRARECGYLKGSVVCVRKAAALLHMAIQAANVVASITQGATVELTLDLEEALRTHGLGEPHHET